MSGLPRECFLQIGDIVIAKMIIEAGDESVSCGTIGIVVNFGKWHDYVVDFENGQSYVNLGVDVYEIEAVQS